MNSTFKAALLGTAASIIGVVSVATSAQAQLDEIIVTAQKKEQNLQEVPIAVSAFGAEQLKLSGVQNVADLQSLSPSLVVGTANTPGTTTTFRIRGIGTTGNNPGLEGAVGFFVDGVYRSRAGTALGDLIDVERIEILRGPQGTLFGKNTSAGAIHVITKKPTDEFEAEGDVSFGNLNSQRVRGVVNVPLIDGILATRWSAGFNRRDGFLENIIDGRDHNDVNRWNVRGQFLYTPTDDIELRVIAEQFQAEEDFGAPVRAVNGSTTAIIGGIAPLSPEHLGLGRAPTETPHRPETTINDVNNGSQLDQQISGELNWDFGFANLTSITAYRFNDSDTLQDVDFTSADILVQDATVEQELFTQEVRLAGAWEDAWLVNNVDWQLGGFFSRENIGRTGFLRNENQFGLFAANLIQGSLATSPATVAAPAPGALAALYPALFPAGLGEHLQTGQNAKGWSVFGHLDIEVLDWLSVVGGARYNVERKEGGMSFQSDNASLLPTPGFVTTVPGIGAVPVAAVTNPLVAPQFNWQVNDANGNEVQDDEWTGNVAIQVRWTDEVMTYVSYAHGYKAGGLNLDRGSAGPILTVPPTAPAATPDASFCSNPADSTTCAFAGTTFGAEFSDTYEFGVKANFWDNRAQLNFTLFDTRFQNFQLNTFTGLGFFISNIGVVNSRGFEAEAIVNPLDGLTLSGGVTFADAQYADNVDASNPPADGPLGDGQLTNSSKWSSTTSATYRHPLANTGGLEGFVHGELIYRSRRNTGSDLLGLKEQKGFSTYNGRIGVAAEDGSWDAALWCRNCGDKAALGFFDAVGQPGSIEAFHNVTREWGVQLTGRF